MVYEEVEKMMSCSSLSSGYALYTCDYCHNYSYVPFTCKSRFCPSCGTKYTLDRADTIATKSINCPHRHITFTIHKDLCPLFQKDRSLLNLLFEQFLLLFFLGFMTKIIKKFYSWFYFYFTYFWA